MFIRIAGLVCLLATAGPVRGAIVFSDNFDQEGLGLNYTGFLNWTPIAGTVDTLGMDSMGGVFNDLLPGNGVYVDLDGSTGQPASLVSNALTLTPGNYTLSFDLAGSQRGDSNNVRVLVGTTADPFLFLQTTLTRASADPFTTVTLDFSVAVTTANVRINFGNQEGDNLGALLDRVVLDNGIAAVPEPSTFILAGLSGIALLGCRPQTGGSRIRAWRCHANR